jgi:trimeric autotransporter adhesin
MYKAFAYIGKRLLYRRILPVLLFTVAYANAAEHRGQVIFSGFGVPGAVITASRDDRSFVTITDGQGRYLFPDLTDGDWNIKIEMQTFSPLQQKVPVHPESPAGQWEIKLLPIEQIPDLKRAPASPPPQASAITATVVKNTAAKKTSIKPTQTQTPFQRTEVKATETASAQRNMEVLPPTTSGSVGDLNSENLRGQAADGFLINGTANNSASSSSALNRSFGNNRGLVRSLYNGSAGVTLGNSALDARPYSLAGIHTPKPSYNQLQGMFYFGGPLRIPHLIRNGPNFFIGYQFTRNRNAQTQSGLMPTAAEREGDLSQASGLIIDPANNLPFSGNKIPADRISPQAQSLLHLLPMPNFTGSTLYNYQKSIVGTTHADSVFGNMRKSFGNKDQLSGNFSFQSSRNDNPSLLGFLDTNRSLGGNLSVNWQHTFSSQFVGVFGAQFNRQANSTVPFFQNRENISGAAGITGNNQEAVNWGPPSIVFYSGLASLNDGVPSSSHTQSGAVTAAIYWNRNKHNVSFGGEYRRQQINLRSQQNPRGTFTFTGAATLGSSASVMPVSARNDFAGFLLGIPDTVSLAFGNADKYFRSSTFNAFIADDWKIHPKFTLNLGLRWDYGSPVTELYGRLVNLDIVPGWTAVTPVVGNNPVGSLTGRAYPNSLLHPDRRSVQPRIGFAWKPISNFSLLVRGGYGIYLNNSPYQSIAMEMAQQSPLSKSLSQQNTPANPLTLADGFNATPNTTNNTFAADPDLRIGYVHIWRLSIQVDLPGALQLTTTYQGTRGKNALQEFLPNTYPNGAANPCPSCPTGFRYMTSHGTSTRDAGTFALHRRLHNGLTATFEYTFAKSIDDAAPGTSGTTGGVFIAQNWLNLKAERALSSFDQRHTASFQFQYTTGMGVQGGMLLKGWRGRLFKEWTLSSQINKASGMPLTPVYPSTVRSTGFTGPVRPDLTGENIYHTPAGQHLNPAAFQAPATGQWGNAGRNSITGPSQFTLSASINRTFRTGDRSSLELNIVANNALNHVIFPSWNTTVGNMQFGRPMSANAMRNVQTTIRWRF